MRTKTGFHWLGAGGMIRVALLLALSALVPFAASAQQPFPKATLNTQITQDFPDNTSNLIVPSILRGFLNNAVTSFQQYAGVNAQVGTSYTIQASDYGQLVTFNNAGAVAVTLPQTVNGGAGAASSFYPFNFYIKNIGVGIVTITPQGGSLINGAANFAVGQGVGVFIISDGTNYQVWSGAVSGGGTNIFAVDVYMGSGRPWCDVRAHGALGNGVADDTAAINACKTTLAALGGGDIFLPPGEYCTFSGINLNSTNLVLVGSGGDGTIVTGGFARGASSLDACGHDVTVLQLSSTRVGFRHLHVNGGGVIAGVATVHSTVVVNNGCAVCFADFSMMTGGYQNLVVSGQDFVSIDSQAGYAYGPTNISLIGASSNSWHIRSKYDQNAVSGCTLAQATVSPSAWVANHVYATCAVVTVTANAISYVLQARVGGTSGNGSSPGIANYGTDIPDNTVTWQLLRPATYSMVVFDTGVAAANLFQVDMTGPSSAVVAIQNSQAGTAPTGMHILHSYINGGLNQGVLAIAGGYLDIVDSQICCGGGSGLTFSTSFTGDVSLNNDQILSNAADGVDISSGSNYIVHGSTIAGNGGIGVNVGNSRSVFAISNNSFFSNAFGSNTGNAVTIGTGATQCTVTDNVGNGAVYSVGACYTNNLVQSAVNSLGADVLLNNTGTYFDGPSAAQGTVGTWQANGTVTLTDTAGGATFDCKLWDGTTVISSGQVGAFGAANSFYSISLSGVLANPAANIRISCKDVTSVSGKILFNASGNSKDSTITAIRIN